MKTKDRIAGPGCLDLCEVSRVPYANIEFKRSFSPKTNVWPSGALSDTRLLGTGLGVSGRYILNPPDRGQVNVK